VRLQVLLDDQCPILKQNERLEGTRRSVGSFSGKFYSCLAEVWRNAPQVADVVAVSLGRVLLLTSGHIIMLRSSTSGGGGGSGGAVDGPDFKHKWRVRVSEIQAVKGAFSSDCCHLTADTICWLCSHLRCRREFQQSQQL